MVKINILFLLIFAGLSFSESEKEKFVPGVQESTSNRRLSFEVFGCAHFTFGHYIKFGGANLPSHMWGGSCGISYQFSPYLVLSCAGSYSYTKNLIYKVLYFGSSEMKFSVSSFSFLVSFKDTNYMIGTGIDISYIKVFRIDWIDWSDDSTIVYTYTGNMNYVRPMVRASAQSNIIYPLYLKIQMESRILHFIKFGSKEIYLPEVQPCICVGLGYTFNF